MDVLEELGHLGGLGRADRDDFVDRLPVEREADFETRGRRAAADLRDRLGLVIRVRRVFALGREDEEHVLPDLEAARLDARPQLFLGRARIGRALERDHLARAAGAARSPRSCR